MRQQSLSMLKARKLKKEKQVAQIVNRKIISLKNMIACRIGIFLNLLIKESHLFNT
jgi:hypothetical protein